MVYECEQCKEVLTPGLMACPRCGLAFDEPVPEDATGEDATDEVAPAAPLALAPPPAPVPAFTMPALQRPQAPARPRRVWTAAVCLAAAIALAGAVWFPTRPAAPPATVTEPPAPPAAPPPAVAAHPSYPGQMTALLGKLRATGVAAQWPALGSRDVLLVTPPETIDGQRTAWSPDLYHALAQGVYADFVFHRYASGFQGNDSTTCFVVVTDPQGRAVAVDFMGQLK